MNVLQGVLQNPRLLVVLLIWSAAWKAVALWHAARNNQLGWYVAMVIINTAGILEIIYLLFFRKRPLMR